MASTLEKIALPVSAGKETRDYLKYSMEMLNVSMRKVLFRAVFSTTAFYLALWFLRAMPWADTGTASYLITLFMERSMLQHASTLAFFVGFWFLILKIPKINIEAGAFELLDFPKMNVFTIGSDEAVIIHQKLHELSEEERGLIIIRRVETAIQRLIHTKSTAEVHDVLNTMCEVDRGIADASYRAVRFSVWLIPVLGFLGTVMGISQAISEFAEVVRSATGLSLDSLKPTLANATYNLGVAFDTTLLALALSTVLVLLMFYVQRKEEVFLSAVDEFCVSEIVNKLYIPNPDTSQILIGLEQVIGTIDHSIGDLAESISGNFNKLADKLEHNDEKAVQELLETIQTRFSEFMTARDKNEEAFQAHISKLLTNLSALIEKGKAVEGFVAGLGGVANLEKILVENQDTLKTLQQSFKEQQGHAGRALEQNKEAFDQLLPPLRELAKGIKIRVGE